MPKFAVISPTHIEGMKEYAWENFRNGGYIAMGSIICQDLSGKSLEEVYELIENCPRYDTKRKRTRKKEDYRKFLSLEPGDIVAVNKAWCGLFGIGIITSNYYFKKNAHDTGATDPEEFYCHFYSVKWLIDSYMKREEILRPGEKGWAPRGIIHVYPEIPEYIKRIINYK